MATFLEALGFVISLFYYNVVLNFKPEAILRAAWAGDGKPTRYAFAVQIENAKGEILLEGTRYLGVAKQEEVEAAAVRLVLEWGLGLRFEKVNFELGFAVPFSEEVVVKGRRPSAAATELLALWTQFRLRRLQPSSHWSPEHPLMKLLQEASPPRRKRNKNK